MCTKIRVASIFKGLESRKGECNMNCSITIDWKFITGLGVAGALLTLANKVDSKAAAEVLIDIANAFAKSEIAE